jgi:hypothetical protein
VYASLAARKAAKLRSGSPADDSSTRTMAGADRTRVQRSVPRAEAEQSAQPSVDKTIKLADAPAPTSQKKSLLVPAILGVLVLSGAAAYFFVVKPSQQSAAQKIEAEAKATRDAAEAAKAEAQAKREARVHAQREAEAQAKRTAEAEAQRAAELKAKRETEAQTKREAELRARREAEAQAQMKREAELRAKREAEAQAKREAEAQAKRESEARGQREVELKAKREAEAKAQREAKDKAQRDAESKAKLVAEASLWDSIKSSRKAADFQKYLNRYPNGQYAEPARQRMLELESARLEEAAKKQNEGEKTKSTIIVPPTF